MVRIISQGFSTPRSRHSSGEEMIDRFAAMKALSALNEDETHLARNNYSAKPSVTDCNTDTNDSCSGADSEEDFGACRSDKDEQNGNCQDPKVVKKERRRERNKLSAQNYRQRRRQQVSAAQKTLEELESHHKILLDKVQHLESEKQIVEEYLRSCVRAPQGLDHQSNNNNMNVVAIPASSLANIQPPCIYSAPSSSCSSLTSYFNGPDCGSASGVSRSPCNSPAASTLPFYPNGWQPLKAIAEDNENNNMPLSMPVSAVSAVNGSLVS